MRVLHVITALGVGGAERMLLKLVEARALSHCEHHVLCMLPGGPMAGPLRAAGARVHETNFLGGLPLVTGTWVLARLARQINPDIVHGWLYHGNLGAAVARATLGRRVPLLWSIRQSLSTLEGENLPARIGIALNRLGSAHPDRLLFNSRTSLAQHRDFGFRMERSEYLPNGFETARFSPDGEARARWRAKWAVPEDAVVFGLLARYHPAKDHASFLKAARLVADARPSARFVLGGTGVDPGNEILMRAIADAGLSGHVQLLGERQEVASVLAALDVYVSSSRTIEAFSNSIGEAMSCALPCVVTQVGDSPDLIDGAGEAVPPGEPQAIAAAMIRMVDLGPAGRNALGLRARRRITSEFDIEAVAGRYAALYASLALQPRGAG